MAKTKLTDELCDKICKDITEGVPIKHASIAHGITDTTFYNWMDKGEKSKSGKFRRFYDRVHEAKSEAIRLRAKRICKAGKSNWQADAWWLERVDPENFGRRETIKQDIQMDANVRTELLAKLERPLPELKDD